jgi:dipeptidyl aminopeptidase/acylaminoacyl peptidase
MIRLFHYLIAYASIPALLAACALAAPTPMISPSPSAVSSATVRSRNTPTETPVPTNTLPAQTPTSPPLPTASANTPITPSVQIEDELKIPMGDGADLIGTFYAPTQATPPWPAVLLLHMAFGKRQEWGDFPQTLGAAGYAVLAIDLRGHGESGGALDWSKGPQDAAQVWQYLTQRPQVDPQRTAIVGASFGANLALVQGATEKSIRTVVLLSPGLDYFGVPTTGAMNEIGERPVLIVASSEDSYAAASSRQLKQMARGTTELQMFEGAGHGINMFAAQPELVQQILGWLDRYLKSR